MERILTIINPAAGGGRCGKRADKALAQLREAGMDLEIRQTEHAGHASELAREGLEEGYRRFLAVGGDGTTYEVVNGLFPAASACEGTVALGILPLGTGNSFLRDFGITDTKEALDALGRWQERPCDVVRAEHADGTIHYINLLSLGFSARVGATTNERFKPFGTLGYVLAVLICVARLEHPSIPFRVDGGASDSRPCALLSFSNSRFTGGAMMMAPRADVSDGELDVIRVGDLGRLPLVRAFPSIFRGTHIDRPDVELRRARRVEFEPTGPQDVMVDGEIVRLDLKSLEVIPQALRVVA